MRQDCTHILALSLEDKDLCGHRHHSGTQRRRKGLFLVLTQFLQPKLQDGAYLAVYRPEVLLSPPRDLVEHGPGHPKGNLRDLLFSLHGRHDRRSWVMMQHKLLRFFLTPNGSHGILPLVLVGNLP